MVQLVQQSGKKEKPEINSLLDSIIYKLPYNKLMKYVSRKFNALRFHGKIRTEKRTEIRYYAFSRKNAASVAPFILRHTYVTAPETEKSKQRRELKFVKTKRSKTRHLKTSNYILQT